ncbi:outer membrane protein assembly factor BamB family protein [Nisaea sediminum]|uniref:outer membrane protein assembly factor BamB family protein n=1 Tax=Nisaea sediminum TaxID=2775867 RepID=UPI00186938CF|nr:PQQ-binding-like beta-propeller repeat protein [Nisaea sediminum]
MTGRHLGRLPHFALLAGFLVLQGCSDGLFFGEEKEGPPLPGERLPILALEKSLVPDPNLAEQRVILPRPVENADWPQPGGNAVHAMHHLAAGDVLRRVWTTDIGSGSDDETQLIASPIVVDGMIYAMDAEGEVSALKTVNGERVWSAETQPDDEDETIYPGALAAGGGKLVAATGYSEVIAFDLKSGAELWRSRLPGPARGAPTVADGRVFVTILGNQAFALDLNDGTRIWSHTGIAEESALLGNASVAVSGGSAIVPYTSGELFVLRVENGRLLWNDNLSSVRGINAVSKLSDIRGNPVVDDDLVIAISQSGRLIATDLNSGRRVWEARVGGDQTPWVAGDYIFVVSNLGEVLALTKSRGRIHWIQQLPVFENPDDKEGLITYSGPVLVSDRLLVGSSTGEVYAISPYTGKVLGKIDIGSAVFVPPVVAGGTVYFLTDDGDLEAFR